MRLQREVYQVAKSLVMATTMHRLQISLPKWEAQFLREQAEKADVSIAEIIRRLVRREKEAELAHGTIDSLWGIVGLVEDHTPLLGNTPVSEKPEIYLTDLALSREQNTPKGLVKIPSKRSRLKK